MGTIKGCEFLSNFCRFTKYRYNSIIMGIISLTVVSSFQIFVDLPSTVTTNGIHRTEATML